MNPMFTSVRVGRYMLPNRLVLDAAAELWLILDPHLVHAREDVEIIDIGRAEVGLHGVEDRRG